MKREKILNVCVLMVSLISIKIDAQDKVEIATGSRRFVELEDNFCYEAGYDEYDQICETSEQKAPSAVFSLTQKYGSMILAHIIIFKNFLNAKFFNMKKWISK